MKKIGFFGGSFDPIHLGHTKMAKDLMDVKSLDEVWFSPARISPFKTETEPASIENRVKMVEIAIVNEPRFQVYEGEVKREGPSYTIDTIKELTRSKDKEFYLIISDESVPGFFYWKQAEEIVQLVPLLIGTRLGTMPPEEGSSVICEAMKKGWVPTQPINISSTEVRQWLREGKDCSAFVSGNVLDFIYQNHLY